MCNSSVWCSYEVLFTTEWAKSRRFPLTRFNRQLNFQQTYTVKKVNAVAIRRNMLQKYGYCVYFLYCESLWKVELRKCNPGFSFKLHYYLASSSKTCMTFAFISQFLFSKK